MNNLKICLLLALVGINCHFAFVRCTQVCEQDHSLYHSRCVQHNATIASRISYLITTEFQLKTLPSVSIIVNVASFCRLTQNYRQFNILLNDFPDAMVFGFPCDQFGHQEPGVNHTEILNSLRHVRPGGGFELHDSLRLGKRGDVNGREEHELFSLLKASCSQPRMAKFQTNDCFWSPIQANDINWNFAMFVVDNVGMPIFRFLPGVEPYDIFPVIRLLKEGAVEHNVSRENEFLREIDEMVHSRVGPNFLEPKRRF